MHCGLFIPSSEPVKLLQQQFRVLWSWIMQPWAGSEMTHRVVDIGGSHQSRVVEGGVQILCAQILGVQGVEVNKSETNKPWYQLSASSHLPLVQHFELVTLDKLLRSGWQSQHHQELVLVDIGLQEVLLVTEQHILQRVSLCLSGGLCDFIKLKWTWHSL